MPTAYLNIGSNKGNSLALIGQAVALIEHLCNTSVRCSGVVKAAPWGYESENPYTNLGVAIDTDLNAHALLDALQAIEQKVSPTPHRDSQGNYIDREIDIDIVAIDAMVIDTPRLTLPHPRMHLREFVLQPMHELAPEWQHPLLGLTAMQMLEQLRQSDAK